MQRVFENDFTVFLLSILCMLFLGCLLRELSKKIKLPEIAGELLAGVLLGPSILGKINPGLYNDLFSGSEARLHILNPFLDLCLIMLMFVCGLKIDLSSIVKNIKIASLISCFGISIPLVTGVLTGLLLPGLFFIPPAHAEFIFPLFLGTIFAIEALPVIARILMDAQIAHTHIGVVILTSAILTDIIGWGIFTFITNQSSVNPSLLLIAFAGLFLYFMIKYGVKLINKLFSNLEDTSYWPNLALSLCLVICFSFTILFEALSLHYCLGAFIAGIILRGVIKNYDSLEKVLEQFVTSFFAPLFFVSIGLRVDFLENFNFTLVIFIFLLASFSKMAAVFIATRLSGIKGKESIIISVALNARGAMGVVFSTIALNLGIISHPTYVALIVMALLTSIISGVVIKKLSSSEPKVFEEKMHFAA